MRYFMFHKIDESKFANQRPDPAMMQKMGDLIGAMQLAGVLVSTDGLKPTSEGVRLSFTNGKRTIIDGPFTETKEMIAGYCIVDVPTRDEAITWSTKFAEIVGDVNIEIRPMFEPTDFDGGCMAPPAPK
jgi:hypothetical protein